MSERFDAALRLVGDQDITPAGARVLRDIVETEDHELVEVMTRSYLRSLELLGYRLVGSKDGRTLVVGPGTRALAISAEHGVNQA